MPTCRVRPPVPPAGEAPVLPGAGLAHDGREAVEAGEPGPLQTEQHQRCDERVPGNTSLGSRRHSSSTPQFCDVMSGSAPHDPPKKPVPGTISGSGPVVRWQRHCLHATPLLCVRDAGRFPAPTLGSPRVPACVRHLCVSQLVGKCASSAGQAMPGRGPRSPALTEWGQQPVSPSTLSASRTFSINKLSLLLRGWPYRKCLHFVYRWSESARR